jgi:hypothetical protein
LCSGHYQQRAKGATLTPLRNLRKPNDIVIDGQSAWIILTDVHGREAARTVIDAADIPRVHGARWGCTHGGRSTTLYVRSHTKGPLHRFLTDCPAGMEVDHISGDPLDNRSANLRIVSHAQNTHNVAQSGRAHLRGVSIQRGGRFMAYATKDGVMHFRCGFTSVEDARAVARDLRAGLMTHVNESRHEK